MSRNLEAHWAQLAAKVESELLARVPENNIRPRLEPTRRAVELLGDPQKSYRVIHVTGTNGKTSTTRFIERILREHGLRTGRFTSPHLVKLNERIAIEGEPVSDQVLVELWEDTKPILEIVDAELAAAGEDPLTFFEALAALGFAIFADAPVDVLVLEVGMGGTWDSTNVADGDVAVFTPIGLDHMDRLGNTISEIAETKAGIIKAGAMVVSALQHSDAYAALRSAADFKAESWAQLGNEFHITAREDEGFGQRFSLKGLAGEYHDLFLPLSGDYQVENLAVAVAAVEAFLGGGQHRIMDDVLRVAVADVSSPGRLQVLSRSPLTLLDAAHNPQGAGVLANALRNSFGPRRFVGVLATLADKDALGVLRELEPVLEEVVITKSTSARALPVYDLEDLAIEVFGEHRVRTAEHFASAIEDARVMVGEGIGDSIIITGSVSLVGDVLRMQQTEAELEARDDDWAENESDHSGTRSQDLDYEDEQFN
ncbi:MAG: hypothetical protein RLZZ603_1180 [Actinomycetota bacterium]